MKSLYFLSLLLFAGHFSFAQSFNRQDTLRGSIGPGREWWDVIRYDITVTPDYNAKSIKGSNTIRFRWLKSLPANGNMQIDLQEPMILDSAIYQGKQLSFTRDGNAWFIQFPKSERTEREDVIRLSYHGHPRIAVNPPWDGGWIFKKDEKNRPWMTVACQGLGASVWYPCKDHQSDEPDKGASLSITVPDTLVAVGNGRLKSKVNTGNGMSTWRWEVNSPINSYNIVPYIGKYVNWEEKYAGEKGNLDCSYWVLDYSLEKAKAQFGRDVPPMLKCFESWFGPYPFYEDSYKMVETPHLGMEHQSAVAYGNKFKNGYLGMDLSGSGWGRKWDYIIIHESGHEWFANNITSDDIADMWVHEGFTDYSEVLFVECQYGKKAADEYCQGLRRNIDNDRPIIGIYGVNKEGSGDMYAKGANLIHTIRTIINDDVKFKQILRGLNKEFYHQLVDTKDIEDYISRQAGMDFSKIFDQYLRTTQIPRLEYKAQGNSLSVSWTNCIKGFNMPVRIISGGRDQWIKVTDKMETIKLADWFKPSDFKVDKNLYIETKEII